MSSDAQRTARLTGAEPARPQRVPPAPARVLARLRMRAGIAPRADHGAPGDARLLVRVDEFPHYQALDEPDRYGIGAFERFHSIMRDADVPYLIAALPRISSEPLDPQARGGRTLGPEEADLLARLPAEGVTIALHGYDHRTRHAHPRRHSELSGLAAAELEERLERGDRVIEQVTGRRPRVFVPPYNRFDRGQWPVLARRYAVIGGGPESVLEHGHWRTPAWRGDAVWLPAYPPFYGTAADVLGGLAAGAPGGWVPVVLHWGWEADRGWTDLERLAVALAGRAAHWDEFLAAVEASR